MAKRIAIIGAGPVGIEAAVYARTLRHDVVVFEKGEVAGNVRSWGFVQLFSPWRMNVTPLGLRTLGAQQANWYPALADVCPSGNEFVTRYVQPLAETPVMQGVIRAGTAVLSVGREDFGKAEAIGKASRATSPFRILTINTSGNESVEQADVLLDCSGTYGNHRWAGRGGIPAPGERQAERKIHYVIPDILGRERILFEGKHTLVLGAGYSAATVLEHLEHLYRSSPQTKVSWAIRRPGQALQAIADDPLAARRSLVQASMSRAASPPPWLQFLGNSVMERLGPGGPPFDVTLKLLNTDLVLRVDQIIALVGYVPDHSIYAQLQVHQCYATGGPMKLAAALLAEGGTADCLSAGAGLSSDALRNPEPNFFILGAKSFGTNSNFLLQIGHKQIRDVFQLIENDAALDLYANR